MHAANPITPKTRPYAFGSFVLVMALYVPYFFLPVMAFDGHRIMGWEGLLFCVVFPPFWPIVLGHLSLWFGSGALLLGHWRAAWIGGVVAIISSFQSWLFLLDEPYSGLYIKLASMIVLVAAGLIGAIRLRATRSPQEPVRIAEGN